MVPWKETVAVVPRQRTHTRSAADGRNVTFHPPSTARLQVTWTTTGGKFIQSFSNELARILIKLSANKLLLKFPQFGINVQWALFSVQIPKPLLSHNVCWRGACYNHLPREQMRQHRWQVHVCMELRGCNKTQLIIYPVLCCPVLTLSSRVEFRTAA